MNKKLVEILLVTGLSTMLNANGFDTKAYVGATAAKLDGETYTQYNLGYTANNYLDNGIILGFGNSLGYGNVKKGVDIINLDMDVKAGHEIINNLNGFILGTGVAQTVDNNSALGLGYGAALEYKVTSNVSLEGSYKTVSMNDSPRDYDYDTTNLAIKFNY